MHRPTLILIPGTLNDEELWHAQIAPLSDLAEVKVADITQGETLADLAQTCLDLSSGPSIFAGFSLGGIVAQEIWRAAPDRVLGLGLLNTTFLPDSPAQRQRRLQMVAAARQADRFIGMGNQLLASYLAPENPARAEIGARIQAMTRRLGPEVFARQSLLEREDNRALLATITCPTLILCGEADRITPPALHEEMAALIPHARFLRLGAAGHMTPMEQPEAVTAALRDLVQDSLRRS